MYHTYLKCLLFLLTGVNPALVDGDVFFFSETNSQTLNEKEKVSCCEEREGGGKKVNLVHLLEIKLFDKATSHFHSLS